MLSPLLLPVIDSRNSYNEPCPSRRPPSSRCPPAMTSIHPFPSGSPFDDVIHRLQKLSIPSRPQSPFQRSPSMSCTNTGGQYMLDSPFAYSWPECRKEAQDGLPTVIDSSFDLSPTSSASSDLDLSVPYYAMSGRDAFFATQSRVIRVSTVP